MDAQARDRQRTSSVYDALPEMPSSSSISISATDGLPIEHHRAAVPLLRQPSCFRPASPSAQLLDEYQQYTGAAVLPQPQPQPQTQPQPQPQPQPYGPAYAFDPELQARYCVPPPAQPKIESPEHTPVSAYPVVGYSHTNQGQHQQQQQQPTEANRRETSLSEPQEYRANALPQQPGAECKCECDWAQYPPTPTLNQQQQQPYHAVLAQQTGPGAQPGGETYPLCLYDPATPHAGARTVPESPPSIPLSSSAILSMTTDSETQDHDSVCRRDGEVEEEQRRDAASRARICAAMRAVHDLCLQSTQAYLQTHRTNRQARAPHHHSSHPTNNNNSNSNNNALPPEPTTSLLQNVSAICGMLWAGAQRDRLHVLDVERLAVDNMAALLAWAEAVALGDRDDWARALRVGTANEGGWFPAQGPRYGGAGGMRPEGANGARPMQDGGDEGDGDADADGEYALRRVFEAGRNLCAWLGVADGVQGMSALEDEIWGFGVGGGGDGGGRRDRMYGM